MRERGERGATMVEAAMVLPMVLLIMFGIVETGRYVTMWAGANTAVREGARFGQAVGPDPSASPPVVQYTSCSGIRDATKDQSGLANLSDSDISITFFDPDTGTTVADCNSADTTYPDPTTTIVDRDDEITVAATATFTPIVPLVGQFFGTMTITSSDTRTIFEGA